MAPKELWIQRADRTFVDEAAQWGISDPEGRGREPVVLDANGDELPDLFVGQEEGVDYPSLNRLWINRGDRFELQEGPWTDQGGNLCAATADIDGDGIDEIAMCTPESGFYIYRSQGGSYVEATEDLGVESYGRRNVEFADLNDDGLPDLVSVARERPQVEIYLNEGGHYGRRSFGLELTDAIDVAFGDIDGDGDLDIYIQGGVESRQDPPERQKRTTVHRRPDTPLPQERRG